MAKKQPLKNEYLVDSLMDEIEHLWERCDFLEEDRKEQFKDGLAIGGLFVGVLFGIIWALLTF